MRLLGRKRVEHRLMRVVHLKRRNLRCILLASCSCGVEHPIKAGKVVESQVGHRAVSK